MTKPDMTPKFNAPGARLQSLVDQTQLLMDQLTGLSDGQSEVIKGGDIAQIIEIVSKRDPIVHGLVNVGEEIGAFIEDPEMIAKVSRGERSKAMGRIASIEHAMKRLRERDAQDQLLMKSTRDAMAEQLSNMGTNQSALRAYSGRPSTPNPILQDRQG